MVQIIDNPSRGALLGQAAGQGIGGALERMAEMRLRNMALAQQRQAEVDRSSKFWSRYVDPQTAVAFANQPPEIQKSLLDRLEGFNVNPQQQMSPTAQAFNNIAQQYGFEPDQFGSPVGQQAQAQQQSGMRIGPSPVERRERRQIEEHEKTRKHQTKLHTQTQWNKFSEKELEKAEPARQAIKIANELKDLVNRGNVQLSSISLRGKPKEWWNEDTKRADQLIQQLVLTKASLGKGVLHKARLAMEEGSKVGLHMGKNEFIKGLDDVIDDPENLRRVMTAEAIDEINSKYGSDIPEDYKRIITDRIKSAQKEQAESKDHKTNEFQKLKSFNLNNNEIKLLMSDKFKNGSEIELADGRLLVKINDSWDLKG